MTDLLPETEIAPPPSTVLHKRLWRPACLFIGLGIAILLAGSVIEEKQVARQPWAEGVFVPEGEPTLENAVPVLVRRVPPENFPSLAAWLEREYGAGAQDPAFRQLLDSIRKNEAETEFVIFAPMSNIDGRALLASGRLPTPGRPEVLAGPLARNESFTMDGTTFQTVGRINPYAGPFLYAYLLPEDGAFRASFSAESGATRGWLHRDGFMTVAETIASREENPLPETPDSETDAVAPVPVGGVGLVGPALRCLGLAGLACVAAGGALLLTQVWRTLHQRGFHGGTPLLHEIVLRPRLWFGLHIALYGVFFAAMLLGLGLPRWNMTLTGFVAELFARGELSYIGEAYTSASIWRAALATFYHNYITATLLFTLVASVIIPGVGVLKSAASFALIGFLMAPLWSGTMSGYSYHCITMALEFEAYILACFAVCVYLACCYRGLATGSLLGHVIRGFMAMTGAALWSGLLLACAAAYEAVTLILFRF